MTTVLLLFFLASCSGDQACAFEDSAQCILNSNSAENFIPDGNEQTIADVYTDTLKQVQFYVDYKNLPTSQALNIVAYTRPNILKYHGVSEASTMQAIDPENFVDNIKSQFGRFSGYSDIFCSATEISTPTAGDGRVYFSVTMPIRYPQDDTSGVMFKNSDSLLSTNQTPSRNTVKFTYNFFLSTYHNHTFHMEQRLPAGNLDTDESGSRFPLIPDTQNNTIEADFIVIPQGQHNRFLIQDVTSAADASITFIKTDNSGNQTLETAIFNDLNTTSESNVKKALEDLFVGSTVDILMDSNTMTVTLNNVGNDVRILQMYVGAVSGGGASTFKMALEDHDGNLFQPIVFDGASPTPIITMNLLPRVIAP